MKCFNLSKKYLCKYLLKDTVPMLLHKMLISTIDVSSVMLKIEIFEFPKPNTNVAGSSKPKRISSITDSRKGIVVLNE